MPLLQARAWLRSQLKVGAKCPCCGQMAKVYRRKLNSGMARSLVEMYRAAPPSSAGGTAFIHLPTTIGARSREEGKLRYWGLVEEQVTSRPDGGRAGWWRVTAKGELFIQGRLQVKRYALVYDGKCLGLDGDPIGIREALGDGFNYAELMAATA